jgi:hypothetical protein
VRRALAAAALAAALVGLAPGFATAAIAIQPAPGELQVMDGPGWHAVNDFALQWRDAPGDERLVTTTHYAIYRAETIVLQGAAELDPERIQHLHIPDPDPAAHYSAAVWFATSTGPSREARVPLLFDDRPPASPRLSPPSGWLGPDATVEVGVEAAPDPPPVSGLGGYAVAIGRGAARAPCEAAVCSAAETDLGPDARQIALGALPEGIYAVAVAAVSGAGVPSVPTRATVRVDSSRPEVALSGIPDGWSAGPVALSAIATDPLSGMATGGPDGPFTAIAVDGEVPKREAGPAVEAVVAGEGVHTVAFWGRDAAGNSGEPGLSLAPPATAAVRIDDTDPAVAFARAQDPAEPERIEATVTDGLSGPSPDRGSIGVRAAGSDRGFEPLPTTVAGGRLVTHWSSDDYPAGRYEFRAAGFDGAGNSATALARAGGAPMVLAAPLKAPVALEFGFGGRKLVLPRCSRDSGGRRCHRQVLESFTRRPALRTVPCGHGVTVGGRLLSSSGAPLRDRELELIETFAAGSRPRVRRTAVRSGPDGGFVARLSPGPSRRLDIAFAGDAVLSRQVGRELRLAVRTGVRFEVSTARARIGGAPVVFSGRVAHPGAPIPHAGLPVALQFRLPGRPWEEFRTLQTDAGGRFHFAYSFTDDDSAGVRFQFRARTPPSGGWPFLPGTSRPLAVTGH